MVAFLSKDELDAIAEFEESARHAASMQAGLLSSILHHNASCAYLQQHGMDGLSDVGSFKSRVPIVDPEDLHPLIQRIADGDCSGLLTSSPITSMLLSSGTSSGRSRLVPATTELRQITLKRFFLSNAIIKRDLSIFEAGKSLNFIYAGKLLTKKGGLKAGSSSTHHLRSGVHLDRLPQWTSPLGVVLGPNVRQSMYCHLLCGLLQAEEVTVISSFLAYGITEAFRFFEDVWEELCNDIATGTLSCRITDDSVRGATLERLQRDPQLAEKVHSECVKGWSGIIKRLWPNVIYINTIVTGSMEPYVPYLKNYGEDVPIVCGDYGSSECTVGINLSPISPPEKVVFTLVPYAAYFEFLPLNQEGGTTTDLTELEVGKEYELIVTTVAGLYRYRLGDVITVTGYYHALPQFRFARRSNVMLSINTDKTDERELCEVVKRVSKRLKGGNMDLLDFTSHADHSSRPGHYTIFWELKNTACTNDYILIQCCQDLDAFFNDPYQRGRAAGTIGPLELCIVKEQTFQNIMVFVLESGASPTQYKTPRCINSVALLNILRTSVLCVYTS
ncbi:hypothetical protein L7F22_058164 [Adiantum nelumboides]|nr:hypothetical protein [Adiantum nelumboides]